MLVVYVESTVFYNVLRLRGGKDIRAWIVLTVELLQLLATIGLYVLRFTALDDQDRDIFRKSALVMLVTSILGFV